MEFKSKQTNKQKHLHPLIFFDNLSLHIVGVPR